MFQMLSELPERQGFWWTLVALNVVFMGVQPAFLLLCVVCLIPLWLIRSLRGSDPVWYARRLAKPVLLGLCWLVTAYGLGAVFAGVGMRVDTVGAMIVVLAINTALWLAPPLVFRHWRKKADEQRTRTEELAHARNEQRRAQALGRRENARANCELLYTQCAPEIGDRLPRQIVDDFLRKYMGDDRSPDDVERRAEELRRMIEQHRTQIDPPKKEMTLADMAHWYLDQKQQIEAVALDDDDRQLLLSQLQERYMKLQEKYLRSVQP